MLPPAVARAGLCPITRKRSIGLDELTAFKNQGSFTRFAAVVTFDTFELPVKSYKTPKVIILRPEKSCKQYNLIQRSFEIWLTMFGGEIPVLGPDILIFPGCGIEYLYITSDIPLSVNFAEVVKGFVSDVRKVKLVVTCDISTQPS